MTIFGHKILLCQSSHPLFPIVLLELRDEPLNNKTRTLALNNAEQTEILHPPAFETETELPIKNDAQLACARKLTHNCKPNENVPKVKYPIKLNKEDRTRSCSKPLKLIVVTVIFPD